MYHRKQSDCPKAIPTFNIPQQAEACRALLADRSKHGLAVILSSCPCRRAGNRRSLLRLLMWRRIKPTRRARKRRSVITASIGTKLLHHLKMLHQIIDIGLIINVGDFVQVRLVFCPLFRVVKTRMHKIKTADFGVIIPVKGVFDERNLERTPIVPTEKLLFVSVLGIGFYQKYRSNLLTNDKIWLNLRRFLIAIKG